MSGFWYITAALFYFQNDKKKIVFIIIVALSKTIAIQIKIQQKKTNHNCPSIFVIALFKQVRKIYSKTPSSLIRISNKLILYRHIGYSALSFQRVIYIIVTSEHFVFLKLHSKTTTSGGLEKWGQICKVNQRGW